MPAMCSMENFRERSEGASLHFGSSCWPQPSRPAAIGSSTEGRPSRWRTLARCGWWAIGRVAKSRERRPPWPCVTISPRSRNRSGASAWRSSIAAIVADTIVSMPSIPVIAPGWVDGEWTGRRTRYRDSLCHPERQRGAWTGGRLENGPDASRRPPSRPLATLGVTFGHISLCAST